MTARVVFKYHIDGVVPASHKFLSAGQQSGETVIWLEVDNTADQPFIGSPYVIIPTGFAEVPKGASHRMTFFSANGNVWHVYDLRGDEP
jgi:hypothetical protein